MTDQDVLDRALPLYESGMGIAKIALHIRSSNGRVRKLLRSHGVDTLARTVCTKETLIHPYGLRGPMKKRGFSYRDVARACGKQDSLVIKWLRDGLSWEDADEVAIRLGYMPQELWDNWWDFE